MRLQSLDQKIIARLRVLFLPIARLAIFVIYFYFGVLKLLDLSPATPLARALAERTVGLAAFPTIYKVLAIYECVIGILFLIPKSTRLVIPLLLIHMLIVVSPLVLVSHLAWNQAFVPTLEGQYIIKNIAIIALAIVVAAQTKPLATRRR